MSENNTTPNPKTTKAPVTFTEEQLALVQKMISDASSNAQASSNNPISPYNVRDIKKIETVNVRRFEGMYVLGFKNLQKDPFKKAPLYVEYGVDIARKLSNEPYVTLLLSNDGNDIVEKKVLLIDYMNNRDTYIAKVLSITEDVKINDHGVLGRVGSDMGTSIGTDGKVERGPAVSMQTKSIIRTFNVELENLDGTKFDYKFETDAFFA